MANKNITSPTAARIFAAWEREGRSERPRTYLGASAIGDPCEMKLWLMFRGAVRENFDGRMYRLFDRGQREEAVFCDDLRRLGCEVKDRDETTCQQFAVTTLGGHFAGHLDAIARGFVEAPKTWHVCEFKTHSDASFKKLCKEGVKAAKPNHYAQMTVYMGLTGLDRAFYLAVNKDNDDLWCERVEFSKADFDAIMARAKRIVDTCEPERCANRPDDYRCKGCACHAVCWHEANEIVDPTVPLLCRTCCHATAKTDGEGAKWTCRLGHPCGTELTCADHLILPVFVDGEIVEGTKSSITYEKDGKRFTIGASGISCSEAQKVGVSEFDGVIAIKSQFAGSTVASANTLETRFAKKDCVVDYDGPVSQMAEWCAGHPYCDWSRPTSTEEANGKKFFEYSDYFLVTVDGDRAKIISENMLF